MKKIKQTNSILILVSIALLVKAYQLQNVLLCFVSIFICLLGFARRKLITSLTSSEENVQGEDSIMKYLKKDSLLYVDMMEVYQKGNCIILYEETDGILLYDHTSLTYYGSALNLAGARDIVAKLPVDYGIFVAHEDVFEQLVNRDFKIHSTLKSYNHVYLKRSKIMIEEHPFELKRLTLDDVEVVKKRYTIKDLCNDQYISGRIKEGMLGAYMEDELAGFIGIHDTGAIGMLEVLPKYRGQHLATILQASYTNYLLDKGYSQAIYGQVNADNHISLHIQEKLSFIKAKTPMYWYFSDSL